MNARVQGVGRTSENERVIYQLANSLQLRELYICIVDNGPRERERERRAQDYMMSYTLVGGENSCV